MEDKNGKELKNGDVINLHQTVNGQNMFIMIDIDGLDLRYLYDISRVYEYSTTSLLSPDPLSGGVIWEIVDSLPVSDILQFVSQTTFGDWVSKDQQ